MKLTNTALATVAALFLAASIIGCTPEGGSDMAPMPDIGQTELPPDTVDDGHDHDHGHSHASEGPHHGGLIELGGEEYHAELVDDEDAGTVTIYILDGAAKNAVPIDAAEITINIKHDGEGEQFKLAASPDAGDPEGRSSRFVSDDEHLMADLHDEDADATLVLTIEGKSFRGAIHHDHDHDHGHGDHEH